MVVRATFNGATFTGTAHFNGATFTGDAWFNRVTSTDHAWFQEVTFTGDAWFQEVTFSSGSEFTRAAFTGDTYFGGATFSGGDFGYATFTGKAWFNATFTGVTLFSEVTFSGDASFNRSTFAGDVWFDSVTFARAADFGEVHVLDFDAPDRLVPRSWPPGWTIRPDPCGSIPRLARASGRWRVELIPQKGLSEPVDVREKNSASAKVIGSQNREQALSAGCDPRVGGGVMSGVSGKAGVGLRRP